MAVNVRPVVPEAIPGWAENEKKRKRRNYDDAEFPSEEDALAAWRSVTLLGILILIEWGVVMLVCGANPASLSVAGGFLTLGGLLLIPCFPIAMSGHTEAALADLGAALTGFALGLAILMFGIPAGVSLALMPTGVVILILGVMGWSRLSRRLALIDSASSG